MPERRVVKNIYLEKKGSFIRHDSFWRQDVKNRIIKDGSRSRYGMLEF